MVHIHWSTIILAAIAAGLAILCAYLWRRKNGNIAAERACALSMENNAKLRQIERRVRALEHRLDDLAARVEFARARQVEEDQ